MIKKKAVKNEYRSDSSYGNREIKKRGLMPLFLF